MLTGKTKVSITLVFLKSNGLPAIGEQLTPNYYVDVVVSNCVDESSLLRSDPNEELKLDEKDSIILNSTSTSPKEQWNFLPKLMLIAYLKIKEIDEICLWCLMIRITNLKVKN